MLLFIIIGWLLFSPIDASAAWQNIPLPNNNQTLQTLKLTQGEAKKTLVASENTLFLRKNQTWVPIWQAHSNFEKIENVFSFKEFPEKIFILTQNRLILGNLTQNDWQTLYQQNDENNRLLSFAITPHDPNHWLLGTSTGLFESDDAGNTWFRYPFFTMAGSIPVLMFVDEHLFVANENVLFSSTDLIHFNRIFDLPEELGDFKTQKIQTLLAPFESCSKMWLGTSSGVYETPDCGNSWFPLNQAGLAHRHINHLAYDHDIKTLYAATLKGVFAYYSKSKKWKALYEGLGDLNIKALSVNPKEGSLVGVTERTLLHYPLTEVAITTHSPLSLSADWFALSEKEPSIQQVHDWVIRYHQVSNHKINQWHKQSRQQALLPNFSFGYDRSSGNNIDLDRGSTSTPDVYIAGPEDLSRGWDVSISWNLGDLVWSSSQTSIDSRAKTMMDFRRDLLSEVTRLYFERRRLQKELFLNVSTEVNGQQAPDLKLRIEELTALIDSLTGTKFSNHLNGDSP